MLSDKRYHYLIVRKVGRTLKHSTFQLLVSLISEYNLSSYFTINKTDYSITCKNGATAISTGLDDVEKLKSIAGINRIWIEEASEISLEDFKQLDLRLRGKNEIAYQPN